MATGHSHIRLLSSLYVSTFLIRTSFGIMLATLQIYLGIMDKLIGFAILSAASPICELCTVLFIGAAVDRRGRKAVLLSGLLVGAAFMFVLAATKNLYAVFAISACHGIAAGAILVSSLALLTDFAPPDRRGREMGAFDAVNMLGWVTGYAVGSLCLGLLAGSLWMAYILAGAMGLGGLAYAYLSISEKGAEQFQSRRIRYGTIVEVLKDRAVLLLTLPWFIVFMMIGAVMTFLTGSVTGGAINISPILLAGAIFAAGVVLISTQVFYGRMSDKHGRMPVMIIGAAGFVGIMVTVGAWFITSPAPDPAALKAHLLGNIFLFGPPIGLFGFMALAFGPSALSSLADEAHEDRRGVTMAVYSVVISAGMFFGILAVGGISDAFGGPGVLAFMLSCAAGMLLLVGVRWLDVRKRKAAQPPAAGGKNTGKD